MFIYCLYMFIYGFAGANAEKLKRNYEEGIKKHTQLFILSFIRGSYHCCPNL